LDSVFSMLSATMCVFPPSLHDAPPICAQVTVRTPVGRVLDLGTGCGIQALHAARHSRAVVATDISRRALGFAAFNAALDAPAPADRKSTRLNSSHVKSSYAVFCLRTNK